MTVDLTTGLPFSASDPSSSLSPFLCQHSAASMLDINKSTSTEPATTSSPCLLAAHTARNSIASVHGPVPRRFALRRRCGLHTELAEVGHEQRTGLVAHCAHDVELGPADPYL
jgi:hypothetical protein